MHIIIALLTAVGGVIWALYRLQNSGVDLNAFNPFYWARRRQWQKQLGVKAIHRLDDPMEAAALLVVGMMQLDGEVTREQKQQGLQLFIDEFCINDTKAAELYAASSHMLKDIANISCEARHILAPSKARYQEHHINSVLHMLNRMAAIEGPASEQQTALLIAVEQELKPSLQQVSRW